MIGIFSFSGEALNYKAFGFSWNIQALPAKNFLALSAFTIHHEPNFWNLYQLIQKSTNSRAWNTLYIDLESTGWLEGVLIESLRPQLPKPIRFMAGFLANQILNKYGRLAIFKDLAELNGLIAYLDQRVEQAFKQFQESLDTKSKTKEKIQLLQEQDHIELECLISATLWKAGVRSSQGDILRPHNFLSVLTFPEYFMYHSPSLIKSLQILEGLEFDSEKSTPEIQCHTENLFSTAINTLQAFFDEPLQVSDIFSDDMERRLKARVSKVLWGRTPESKMFLFAKSQFQLSN